MKYDRYILFHSLGLNTQHYLLCNDYFSSDHKIQKAPSQQFKALPDYNEQIQKFEADSNSKLDNDHDISRIITMLNLVQ